jgi:antitoxin MazE
MDDDTAHTLRVTELDGGLGLRLPDDVAQRLGLSAGDVVRLTEEENGRIGLEKADRLQALKQELGRFRLPLPTDYKFDREEANSR